MTVPEGTRAALSDVTPCGAALCRVLLSGTVLCDAALCGVALCSVSSCDAVLCGTALCKTQGAAVEVKSAVAGDGEATFLAASSSVAGGMLGESFTDGVRRCWRQWRRCILMITFFWQST